VRVIRRRGGLARFPGGGCGTFYFIQGTSELRQLLQLRLEIGRRLSPEIERFTRDRMNDDDMLGMQHHAGPQAVPDFDPLRKSLERIRKILSQNLAARTTANSGAQVSGTPGEAAGRPDGVDVNTVSVQRDGRDIINSRQDAIRAIDAAVLFFRRYEPSSPVPLLLERARRLVSKSFMEVLEDIAPEGVPQAKLVGGIRAAAE